MCEKKNIERVMEIDVCIAKFVVFVSFFFPIQQWDLIEALRSEREKRDKF
jgi:hypothetical protein